jgi:hypothetical protein
VADAESRNWTIAVPTSSVIALARSSAGALLAMLRAIACPIASRSKRCCASPVRSAGASRAIQRQSVSGATISRAISSVVARTTRPCT